MEPAKHFRILAEREIAELIRDGEFEQQPPDPRGAGLLSHSLWRRPLFDDAQGAAEAPYWGTWGSA